MTKINLPATFRLMPEREIRAFLWDGWQICSQEGDRKDAGRFTIQGRPPEDDWALHAS